MAKLPPIPAADLIPIYLPWWVIRAAPYQVPGAAWDDPPFACLEVNVEWASHIRGLLEVLQWTDAWAGTDEEKQAAVDAAIAIEDSFNVCPSCCETTVTALNNVIANQLRDAYDGTNESVAPDAPDTTFGLDSDDDTEAEILARRAALCSAVDRFVRTVLEEVAKNIRRAGVVIGIGAGLILGVVAQVWGVVIGGALGAAIGEIASALEDSDAIEKVVCCMYQHLMTLDITEENFQSAPGPCGFGFGTNEAQIAGVIANQVKATANYLAFIRILGEEYRIAFLNSSLPAACECVGGCEGLFDFETYGRLQWYLEAGSPYGTFETGDGWQSTADGEGNHHLNVSHLCSPHSDTAECEIVVTYDGAEGVGNGLWLAFYDDEETLINESAQALAVGRQTKTFTNDNDDVARIEISVRDYPTEIPATVHIHSIDITLQA